MTEVSDLFKILLLNKTSVTFRYDFSMKEWFHVGNSKLKILTKLIIIGRRELSVLRDFYIELKYTFDMEVLLLLLILLRIIML